MRKYLLFVIVTALLGSCSGTTPPEPINPEFFAADHGYQIVRTSGLESYLQGLVPRIRRAGTKDQPVPFGVWVLNEPRSLALSLPGGTSFISTGLLMNLETEAELVFILAHELAHHVLGHLQEYKSELDLEELRERELAADRWGTALLARLGYDPRVAIIALQRCYRALNLPSAKTLEQYPNLEVRLSEVSKAIAELQRLPLGTSTWGMIDSRAFRRMQAELSPYVKD